MTKCRKWCIVKEEEEEIFIQVQGSSGNIPLTHKQAPHRKYSAVKGCVVYNKNKQLVKVFFKGGDTATAFDPNFFLWNAGDTSYELRPFIKDVTKFAAKLNQMVGSAPLVEMEAQVHQEMEVTPNQSSAYEWDVSGNDIPEIGVSPVIHHSTPARPRKRGTDVADLPMLFKTKKTMKESVDETIMEEVKGAYLGSTRIPTGHLRLGVQLREIRESFVQKLMDKMTEFPGHFYQPLCVIIDTLDDTTQFKENSANGYHYKVIGGCHNHLASERLSHLYPAQEVYQSRICTIFKNTLSEEAKLWLANRHNKDGEFRHSMSLREKIQLCRNIFETSGFEDGEDKWQSIVSAVLGPEEKKGVVKVLVKLATLDHDSYQMLHQMLTLHSNGKLKGQKLSPADIANGPDLRPYTFVGLPELRPSAIQRVLSEVRDKVMSVSEMQKEVKLLNKLLRVQRFFVDLVGATSWDDAQTRFPQATTREVLEHFCKCNLRSTPGELKTFCRQLQREEDMKFDGFQGAGGAIGTLLNCDVALFEAQMLEDIPVFTGSSLIILDMPEDWMCAEVKSFINHVTSVNINHRIEDFTFVILSPVREMATLQQAIRESRHFNEPMSVFYMINNQTPSNDGKLVDCVGGATIAQKGCSKTFTWPAGHRRNYLEVSADPHFCVDGAVVDDHQKPIQLYHELILAFTCPKDWVIDACSGTGTGCIAALREGRNVVALEKDAMMIEHLKLRLSKEVTQAKRKEDASQEEGDEEDDEEEEDDDDDDDDEETLNLS